MRHCAVPPEADRRRQGNDLELSEVSVADQMSGASPPVHGAGARMSGGSTGARYRFFTCDVFTETRFGGNPLAVLPAAAGLSDRQMQAISREFNYSETAFVLPAEAGHTRRVRIFTPTQEVPFAGHPNIGTAFVLAATGALGPLQGDLTVVFEERAGLVPITIAASAGRIRCELAAPERLTRGRTVDPATLAAAVSLSVDDLRTTIHPPQEASVGLRFLVAELTDLAALGRARPDMTRLDALAAAGVTPEIHLYTRVTGELDLRARMFAPLDSVPEDPATGSANAALGALLADCDPAPAGRFHWRVGQGIELGRPSRLEVAAVKRDGEVVEARVGGGCVLVSEGEIDPGP